MSEPTGLEARAGARFIVPQRFLAAAAALAASFFFVVQAGYGQSNSESGIAQRHAQHLRHGINLSEWFAQVYDQKGYTKEHFETWTTAQDIALIKAMGFDHVRLCESAADVPARTERPDSCGLPGLSRQCRADDPRSWLGRHH
jgi:hypothetical protein